MATKTLQQIASAKAAGYKDYEIWNELRKTPDFNESTKRARAAGYTQEQIAKDLGLNVRFVDSKPKPRPRPQQPAPKPEKPSFLADVGAGMDDVFSGVKQGVLYAKDAVTGGDDYDKFTKAKAEEKALYEKTRKASGAGMNVGRFVGQTVATLPAAGLSKSYGAAKLVSLPGIGITVQNAAVGGAIGGVGFAENAEQRKQNIKSGAIGGAAGGIVAKKVGDTVTKAINVKQNRLVPGAQEIDDLGKQFGVKTTVGDVSRNPIAQRAEVQMERVPLVGTTKFRQTQQAQVKDAASKVLDTLKTKLDDVDYKSIPKIQSAANAGDKNAIRIMGIVNGAGDDTGKVLQAAAEIKNWRGNRVSSQMYDRVQKLAGPGAVTPNKTVQSIDDIIASDSKVTPNAELQKELLAIRKNLVDMNIKKDFKEMRAVQSRLGELVDKWGRQGENTSAFTKVRTAIDNDLLDFAQSSGNTRLFGELKRANALYAQLQSGKDKAFANATRSAEPDQIFNNFMKAGKGDKAANFYKNLDPKGQAALRYQMAENAFEKAWDPNKEIFSPAKFAQEFERNSAPYSNVFKGGDKAQMDGFIKLMRHVERAGQYIENQPNGQRAVDWMIVGGTALNPALAAKVGGLSAMAKVLLTTEAGKRILLAAKDLPPGSAGLTNLFNSAQKLAVVGAANQASR
ncbi:hypothetical protein [Acinetobacter sp. YH12201]|uniref:hypothetical protein n=1 Tax=Acinetobacter sp. YH12201 TaxID=2601140 RepID=UPI0015D333AE|nr:hypothetical protein [Acinetobacter sp. YH12201]